jgi:hypothetical protein
LNWTLSHTDQLISDRTSATSQRTVRWKTTTFVAGAHVCLFAQSSTLVVAVRCSDQ